MRENISHSIEHALIKKHILHCISARLHDRYLLDISTSTQTMAQRYCLTNTASVPLNTTEHYYLLYYDNHSSMDEHTLYIPLIE